MNYQSNSTSPTTLAAGPAVSRVAIVLSQLRPGGMERVVVHLAGGLAKKGIETLVICLQRKGTLARNITSAGISVVALESLRSYDIGAGFRLAGIFRKFQPSVINVHDYSSLPYAALAALLAGNTPLVFSAHGLLYQGFDKPLLRHRLASRRLATITAVSPKVADRHTEYLTWTKNIHIVPNGVPDMPRNNELGNKLRKELGIAQDSFVFLAAGNARPEKGFEILLDATRLLRKNCPQSQFVVLVAGDLPDTSYCQQLLQKHKEMDLAHDVRFLGFHDDISALYSAANAFVLSSHSEGLPMVVLEAMMAGLPIVATRVGGLPSVVSDDNGLLVEPASPEQLSQAMTTLLKNTPLCTQKGQNARKLACENYSVDKMTARYLRVFDEVTNCNTSVKQKREH